MQPAKPNSITQRYGETLGFYSINISSSNCYLGTRVAIPFSESRRICSDTRENISLASWLPLPRLSPKYVGS